MTKSPKSPLYRSATRTYLSLLFALILFQFPTEPSPSPPSLSIHIFSTPKPVTHPQFRAQIAAINSWKRLTSQITLLGDASTRQISRRLGVGYHIVDTTQDGLPLLNSMLHTIISITSRDFTNRETIVIFVNADIHLYDDLLFSLNKLSMTMSQSWVAIAARTDIDAIRSRKQVREQGVLHGGGVDLWAWRKGISTSAYIPPFVIGQSRYDNWLTHQLIKSSIVVDISHVITAAHRRHEHDESGDLNYYWYTLKGGFQLVNAYLAERNGDFENQMGTTLHAPFVLMQCADHDMCLIRRRRPGKCHCEYSSFVQQSMSDAFVVNGSRVVICGLKGVAAGEVARRRITSKMMLKLDNGREHMLKRFRDLGIKRVILTAISDGTAMKEVLRLICSLRKADLFRNNLIAALDDGAFVFGMTHGLPIYREHVDDVSREMTMLRMIYDILVDFEVLFVQPNVVIGPEMARENIRADIGLGKGVFWARGKKARSMIGRMLARMKERSVTLQQALREEGLHGVRVRKVQGGGAEMVRMDGDVCVYDMSTTTTDANAYR